MKFQSFWVKANYSTNSFLFQDFWTEENMFNETRTRKRWVTYKTTKQINQLFLYSQWKISSDNFPVAVLLSLNCIC